MSYDIHFCDPVTGSSTLEGEPYQGQGGTYAVGGINEAWLNITYNYAVFYYWFLDKDKGIRALYGKTGEECLPFLEAVIEILGTKRYEKDYWAPTPGNAGAALQDLLELARRCPTWICEGD